MCYFYAKGYYIHRKNTRTFKKIKYAKITIMKLLQEKK